MAPVKSTLVGRLLDVLRLAAENENDSLPWLRTQSKGVEQGSQLVLNFLKKHGDHLVKEKPGPTKRFASTLQLVQHVLKQKGKGLLRSFPHKRELITLVHLQRVAHGSLTWQLGDPTKILPLLHMSVL